MSVLFDSLAKRK